MYNVTVLAILERAGLITHDAAEELAKALADKIHPTRYDDAVRLIDQALEKVKDLRAEPWKNDLAKIERRMAVLEKQADNGLKVEVAKHKVG